MPRGQSLIHRHLDESLIGQQLDDGFEMREQVALEVVVGCVAD